MADIFSYGLDKTLNRSELMQPTSRLVYDYFSDAAETGVVPSGGHLTFKSLTVSGITKMVSPGDDIQAAINAIATEGGGTIQFKSGTYGIVQQLNLYSSVNMQGTATDAVILDFRGSANIVAQGTNVYSAGTISNITGGVNVTGSGTLWLSNLTVDHQLFVGNRWYKISTIVSDTSLTLAEGYAGGATFPGASYRAAKIVRDVEFRDMSFKNSTGTAIAFTNCRSIFIEDCDFIDNNKGFTFDNCSEISVSESSCISNSSNGAEFNTCSLMMVRALNTPSNGGSGVVINNNLTSSFLVCASSANTADGYNVTDATELLLNVLASFNTGQGIELVSGCNRCLLTSCIADSNTSDGIKLTGTSDNNIISDAVVRNNGGYGINIAASTNDDTLINPCRITGNTSGDVDDKGTNTFYQNTGSGAFTAANGNNNNIDTGANKFVRIAGPTVAFTITGITNTANAKMVMLYNSTSQNMTLANDNTGSTFTQRIITLTGVDVALANGAIATLIYNNTDKIWLLLGTQG